METLFKILDAALIIFILSAIHFYVQHRKRANASINLIHQYAKEAKKNVDARINSYKSMRDTVIKGNPYGEPSKDFTPLLFYTKEDELSFEQISEILRYLRKKEQILLLKYFAAQSTTDTVACEINTDYFRTIPQNRKAHIIEVLQRKTEELKIATDNLVKVLDKRGNIRWRP